MGIGDEAANSIDGQILATQELGWKLLEPRGVEVPGFAKANSTTYPTKPSIWPSATGDRRHRRLLLRFHHHELGQESGRPLRHHPGRGQTRHSPDAAPRRQVRPHHELQAGRRRIQDSARGFPPREGGHQPVPRRRPPARPRELHELRRHELAARPRIARQVPRPQMGLRHRQPHLQSRPLQAQALAQTGPVGVLDPCARSRRPHPHQGRHLEPGQERRGLQLARRRAGQGARHPQGRPGARLRRRPLHRTPHGRRLPRRPIQGHQRGRHAQELRRIRPAAGEDGWRDQAGTNAAAKAPCP